MNEKTLRLAYCYIVCLASIVVAYRSLTTILRNSGFYGSSLDFNNAIVLLAVAVAAWAVHWWLIRGITRKPQV